MKNIIKALLEIAIVGVITFLILGLMILGLNGCSKSDRVNFNIKQDADNFKVTRRVIALNTRTNEPLFSVEGKISINTDNDGDLNVTIKTDEDSHKLFYAHLSKDVTYTSVQIDASDVDPYAYDIQFFPAKEAIEHGLINIRNTDEED